MYFDLSRLFIQSSGLKHTTHVSECFAGGSVGDANICFAKCSEKNYMNSRNFFVLGGGGARPPQIRQCLGSTFKMS